MSFLLTGITFFIILTVLVLIHELGHYWVARKIGVQVDEFGFGLPPRIVGKRIGKTIYSLNWLPIGGFVRLAGEDDEGGKRPKGATAQKYFWARSKRERSAILLAGVTMNFLLSVVITSYLLTDGVHEPSGRVHVEDVALGTPAADAGLMVDDIIYSIAPVDGTPVEVTTPSELIEATSMYLGEEVVLSIERDGALIDVSLTPRVDPPEGQGAMGVAISDMELVRYPWYTAPIEATRYNLVLAWQMLVSMGSALWRLVTFTQVGRVDVAGPIGIAQITGQAVQFGFRAVLEFASILSLNLAVLNLLPIPALDGGRLVFVFLEKVMGKRVRPAFERTSHQFGMILLFGILILVTFNDILRIVQGL